jgi:hypothetical protein
MSIAGFPNPLPRFKAPRSPVEKDVAGKYTDRSPGNDGREREIGGDKFDLDKGKAVRLSFVVLL